MKRRGSGILCHITSLPSPHGIGDLGPGAYAFADFLYQAKQSYWQVLPLNPTNQRYADSPFTSMSSCAGNTVLISPDQLLAFQKEHRKAFICRTTTFKTVSFIPALTTPIPSGGGSTAKRVRQIEAGYSTIWDGKSAARCSGRSSGWR